MMGRDNAIPLYNPNILQEEEVDNGEVPIETTEELCEEDMELMTAMGFSSFGGSKREQTSQKVTFLCNCKMFYVQGLNSQL
jgi:hypothetical protein